MSDLSRSHSRLATYPYSNPDLFPCCLFTTKLTEQQKRPRPNPLVREEVTNQLGDMGIDFMTLNSQDAHELEKRKAKPVFMGQE